MDGRSDRRAWHVHARAAALALVLVPGAGWAAPTCAFGVANALAFGSYDPLAAAPADSTSTISYRCPKGQDVRILLDFGLGAAAPWRELRQGTETLRYNLYLDAQRTIVWGDGTAGSQAGPGAIARGASGTTSAYVFGRIPAAQDAVAGVYSDTIRITFEL